MKNFVLHLGPNGPIRSLFGLLIIISAVIVNCQVEYDYEQDLNQNFPPLESNYQDMGNLENVVPPDFNQDPFPNPDMNPLDPFSRRNQVKILFLEGHKNY